MSLFCDACEYVYIKGIRVLYVINLSQNVLLVIIILLSKVTVKHSSQRLFKPLSLNGLNLKQNIYCNAPTQGIGPTDLLKHV